MTDFLSRYNSIKQQAISVRASYNSYKTTLQSLGVKYTQAKEEYKQAQEWVDVQEASISTMRIIIDRMSAEQIKKVTNLMTYALQTIFFDKNYSVEMEIGDKRGLKSAEFFLIEKLPNGNVLRSEFNDGIGGGVLCVVGFVLQLYYIRFFGLSHVMFCDESFSQLSDAYMPYLKSFINNLSSKMHFTFVLVTHDERLVRNADKIYRVDNGIVEEITESQAIKVVNSSMEG